MDNFRDRVESLVRQVGEAGVVVIEAKGGDIKASFESIGGLIEWTTNLGKDLEKDMERY